MRGVAILAAGCLVLMTGCSEASPAAESTDPIGSTSAAPVTATTTQAAAPDTTTTTATPGDLRIEAVTFSEEGESPDYQVLATVPRIAGLANDAVATTVNTSLEAMGTDSVTAFLDVLTDAEDLGSGNELAVTYEVTLLTADLASFRFYHFVHFDGTAPEFEVAERVVTSVTTIVLDLHTGRTLRLGDFLNVERGLDPRPALSLLAAWQVAEQVYGIDFREVQTVIPEPEKLDVSRFALRAEGFEVSFDQYEVGPRNAGPVTVFIPYEEFGILINQEGYIPALLQK